jgi:NAD(P)-dependent dehydrogenase (short-subunit alcohol dehydrogenase family)
MARTALVTGGARGIGLSVCRALAEDGVRVAIADLSAEACVQAAEALQGMGHGGLRMDVADEASVAGVLLFKPDGDRPLVAETALADWQRTLGVNLTGCFLSTREYARRVPPRNDQGRIVTISSSAAQLGGYRSSAAYIASKAGVLGLTKALARELAPHGITANAVAPGLIDAPMLRLSLDPQNDAEAASRIPMNRIGVPDDVAGTIRFLVSPAAAYLTGVTIDVNGGYRMQ